MPDSDDPDYSIPTSESDMASPACTIGIIPNMYAYAEARVFDDSVGPQGEEGFDVLTIGVHYGFTVKGFHRR